MEFSNNQNNLTLKYTSTDPLKRLTPSNIRGKYYLIFMENMKSTYTTDFYYVCVDVDGYYMTIQTECNLLSHVNCKKTLKQSFSP